MMEMKQVLEQTPMPVRRLHIKNVRLQREESSVRPFEIGSMPLFSCPHGGTYEQEIASIKRMMRMHQEVHHDYDSQFVESQAIIAVAVSFFIKESGGIGAFSHLSVTTGYLEERAGLRTSIHAFYHPDNSASMDKAIVAMTRRLRDIGVVVEEEISTGELRPVTITS